MTARASGRRPGRGTGHGPDRRAPVPPRGAQRRIRITLVAIFAGFVLLAGRVVVIQGVAADRYVVVG